MTKQEILDKIEHEIRMLQGNIARISVTDSEIERRERKGNAAKNLFELRYYLIALTAVIEGDLDV